MAIREIESSDAQRDVVSIVRRLVEPIHSTQTVNNLLQEELRDTSIETEKAAVDILGSTKVIDGLMEQLRLKLHSSVDQSRALSEQSVAALAQLRQLVESEALGNQDYLDATLQRIHEVSADHTTVSNHLYAHVETFIAEVDVPMMDILAAMQFQDIMRQRLEHVDGALDYVNEKFDQLLINLSDPNGQEDIQKFDLKKLFNQYCMASQRNIHQNVIGEETEAVELLNIDLF